MGRSPAKGYAHSSYARRIVNDLSIAKYGKSSEVSIAIARVREDLCEEVSPNTKTIVFENVSGEPVKNWKSFYNSFNFFARHFLVRDLEGGARGVTRHYTICNAMQPAVFKGYINALKDESETGYAPFAPSLLEP